MDCTNCGKYTLFPPLCADCEKKQQAGAPPELPELAEPAPNDVLEVAAKELGMSEKVLEKKLTKGGSFISHHTKITLTRTDGDQIVTESIQGQNYDALLRLANSRDVNTARLKKGIKALVWFAAFYWLALPLIRATWR